MGHGKESKNPFLIVFAFAEMVYIEMDDNFNRLFILYNNAFSIFYTSIGKCYASVVLDLAFDWLYF